MEMGTVESQQPLGNVNRKHSHVRFIKRYVILVNRGSILQFRMRYAMVKSTEDLAHLDLSPEKFTDYYTSRRVTMLALASADDAQQFLEIPRNYWRPKFWLWLDSGSG